MYARDEYSVTHIITQKKKPGGARFLLLRYFDCPYQLLTLQVIAGDAEIAILEEP